MKVSAAVLVLAATSMPSAALAETLIGEWCLKDPRFVLAAYDPVFRLFEEGGSYRYEATVEPGNVYAEDLTLVGEGQWTAGEHETYTLRDDGTLLLQPQGEPTSVLVPLPAMGEPTICRVSPGARD